MRRVVANCNEWLLIATSSASAPIEALVILIFFRKEVAKDDDEIEPIGDNDFPVSKLTFLN